MRIPFLDLARLHQPIVAELEEALRQVLHSGSYAGGPCVEQFEEEFARFCGVAEAVGVSSGTDALWLALLALDIGPGDEVITVPNTFMATVEAIIRTGARPVLVDVEPESGLMDPALVLEAITSRTRAIVPVHLHGRMAAMDRICEIAFANELSVVEDACQAHGARLQGRAAGTWGDLGAFSFYPAKNLGALGDAGAVTTPHPELAARVRALREHGQVVRGLHGWVSGNARMDAFQAATLLVKLPRLASTNERRRQLVRRYTQNLAASENLLLPEDPGESHVHHLFAIRSPFRDTLQSSLAQQGIETRIHYPRPVHFQPAFSEAGGRRPAPLPHSEAFCSQTLSLPLHPALTEREVDSVCLAVRERAAAFTNERQPVAA